MRVFQMREIEEAIQYARDGGQAVHLHDTVFDHSPKCFRDAVLKRGEQIAHLFDLDKARLVKLARSLGVRVVYIDREDTPSQHIDLCGLPLRRLLAMVKRATVREATAPEPG